MKARNVTKVTRSRGRTAWDLCLDVIKAIKKEPRRANMRTTIATGKGLLASMRPACNSVGCFAGWIDLKFLGKNAKEGRRFFDQPRANDPLHFARMILDGKDYTGGLDFHTAGDDGFFVFNAGEGDDCDHTRPGTPAHARAVVKRIRKFMRINRTALKARLLKDARKELGVR